MEIVRANLEDETTILEMQKLAYVSEAQLHDDFNIPPLTQTLDELIEEFQTKTILKIVEDGKIVASGQARLEGNTCCIGRMAVWPELKGQGLGSILLANLETLFPDAKRIELFTGVNSKANLTMYERRGYEAFKQQKLGKTTVVYLQKWIG